MNGLVLSCPGIVTLFMTLISEIKNLLFYHENPKIYPGGY